MLTERILQIACPQAREGAISSLLPGMQAELKARPMSKLELAQFLVLVAHVTSDLRWLDRPMSARVADRNTGFHPRGLLDVQGAEEYAACIKAMPINMQQGPAGCLREPKYAVPAGFWVWRTKSFKAAAETGFAEAVARKADSVADLEFRALQLDRVLRAIG